MPGVYEKQMEGPRFDRLCWRVKKCRKALKEISQLQASGEPTVESFEEDRGCVKVGSETREGGSDQRNVGSDRNKVIYELMNVDLPMLLVEIGSDKKSVEEFCYAEGLHVLCEILELRAIDAQIGDVSCILDIFRYLLTALHNTFDDDINHIPLLVHFLSERHKYYVDIHWVPHELTFMRIWLSAHLSIMGMVDEEDSCPEEEEEARKIRKIQLDSTLISAVQTLTLSLVSFPHHRIVAQTANCFNKDGCKKLLKGLTYVMRNTDHCRTAVGRRSIARLLHAIVTFGLGIPIAEGLSESQVLYWLKRQIGAMERCPCSDCNLGRRMQKVCRERDEFGVLNAAEEKKKICKCFIEAGGIDCVVYLLELVRSGTDHKKIHNMKDELFKSLIPKKSKKNVKTSGRQAKKEQTASSHSEEKRSTEAGTNSKTENDENDKNEKQTDKKTENGKQQEDEQKTDVASTDEDTVSTVVCNSGSSDEDYELEEDFELKSYPRNMGKYIEDLNVYDDNNDPRIDDESYKLSSITILLCSWAHKSLYNCSILSYGNYKVVKALCFPFEALYSSRTPETSASQANISNRGNTSPQHIFPQVERRSPQNPPSSKGTVSPRQIPESAAKAPKKHRKSRNARKNEKTKNNEQNKNTEKNKNSGNNQNTENILNTENNKNSENKENTENYQKGGMNSEEPKDTIMNNDGKDSKIEPLNPREAVNEKGRDKSPTYRFDKNLRYLFNIEEGQFLPGVSAVLRVLSVLCLESTLSLHSEVEKSLKDLRKNADFSIFFSNLDSYNDAVGCVVEGGRDFEGAQNEGDHNEGDNNEGDRYEGVNSEGDNNEGYNNDILKRVIFSNRGEGEQLLDIIGGLYRELMVKTTEFIIYRCGEKSESWVEEMGSYSIILAGFLQVHYLNTYLTERRREVLGRIRSSAISRVAEQCAQDGSKGDTCLKGGKLEKVDTRREMGNSRNVECSGFFSGFSTSTTASPCFGGGEFEGEISLKKSDCEFEEDVLFQMQKKGRRKDKEATYEILNIYGRNGSSLEKSGARKDDSRKDEYDYFLSKEELRLCVAVIEAMYCGFVYRGVKDPKNFLASLLMCMTVVIGGNEYIRCIECKRRFIRPPPTVCGRFIDICRGVLERYFELCHLEDVEQREKDIESGKLKPDPPKAIMPVETFSYKSYHDIQPLQPLDQADIKLKSKNITGCSYMTIMGNIVSLRAEKAAALVPTQILYNEWDKNKILLLAKLRERELSRKIELPYLFED